MEEAIPPDDQDPAEEVPPPDPTMARGAVELLTLGLSAATALAVGGGLGYLLDRWAGTSPWFTLVGVALGIVTAVMMTVARVRKYLR